MAIYWDTLARWIPQRAKRDALGLGVPLVFLQAVDECNSIDRSAAQRLLNVPNIHKTGHMHGAFPSHVGTPGPLVKWLRVAHCRPWCTKQGTTHAHDTLSLDVTVARRIGNSAEYVFWRPC